MDKQTAPLTGPALCVPRVAKATPNPAVFLDAYLRVPTYSIGAAYPPAQGHRPLKPLYRAVSGDACVRAAGEAPPFVPLSGLGARARHGTVRAALQASRRAARAPVRRGCGKTPAPAVAQGPVDAAVATATSPLLVCGSHFLVGAPGLTDCRAAGAMSVSEIFVELQGFLAAEQDIREEIRKVVQSLEQTAREILTLLQGVHQGTGFQDIPKRCLKAREHFSTVKTHLTSLKTKFPAEQYYRFHEHWRFVLQRLVFLAAFVVYLETETLVTREAVTEILGIEAVCQQCHCWRLLSAPSHLYFHQ
ncbi:translin isoform X2 [Mus pahari]|uniref:translin isoform X2 n=1 Tax=Mus pahari TaxID=10093 RepID=UPI001114DB43|nr:translin isoform X2 [Mus pahari]